MIKYCSAKSYFTNIILQFYYLTLMHPKFLSFIFPSFFCPDFLIYFLLPFPIFSPFPILPLFHFPHSFPSFSPFPFSLLFLSIPSFPIFLFSFFPFFLFSFHPFTPVFSSDLLVYGCKRVLYKLDVDGMYMLNCTCSQVELLFYTTNLFSVAVYLFYVMSYYIILSYVMLY